MLFLGRKQNLPSCSRAWEGRDGRREGLYLPGGSAHRPGFAEKMEVTTFFPHIPCGLAESFCPSRVVTLLLQGPWKDLCVDTEDLHSSAGPVSCRMDRRGCSSVCMTRGGGTAPGKSEPRGVLGRWACAPRAERHKCLEDMDPHLSSERDLGYLVIRTQKHLGSETQRAGPQEAYSDCGKIG